MEWFRFYTSTLDSAKVQGLTSTLFKYWVNLCCLARVHDGPLPAIEEMSFRLRTSEAQLRGIIESLIRAKLIDIKEDGALWMHDWDEHQHVSDDVSARVRKHRAKQVGNVTVTPPEQKQIQSRTEQKQTDPPIPVELQPQAEYPETLLVLLEHDRTADTAICQQLAGRVAAELVTNPRVSDWPMEKRSRAASDPVIARACRESYATPRKSPHGTMLLMLTVPKIIIGAKLNYA